jgi:hypothetical protein
VEMDRRSFLINSARAFGAALTLNFISRVEHFVQSKNSPLLLKPDNHEKILFAIDDDIGGYQMYLGKHPLDDHVPDINWRDLIIDHWGWSEKDGINYLQEDYGISKKEAKELLDTIAPEDSISDWFFLSQSANAKAYFYLAGLDLGPEFGQGPDTAGEIRFIDGYMPGNDTRMVEVPENVSLSLLQARLIDLGENVKIELGTWKNQTKIS